MKMIKGIAPYSWAKFILFIVLLFIIVNTNIVAQKSTDKFSISIISAESNTWGYIITKNGKKYIIQTTIPSLAGTKGFVSKEDATKVAKLVINKLKLKNDLPTISKEELNQLHIKY